MLVTAPGIEDLATESAFAVLARAGALAAQGRDIINLGIGQPDFRTPEPVVEAAIRALRDGHHGYTPAPGLPALREAVAAYLLRQYGVAISPTRVMIVPGGKVTLWFAALAFGAPGTEILIPDPGFPIYASAARFTGARAVAYPLAADGGIAWTADAILERVTPATRLIIVNSPGNPTGGVVSAAEVDRLADGLQAFPQAAVLSDEIYARMVFDGRRHESLLTRPSLADRLILLDGWSKTYAMTGWRLGFAVWPAALADVAERLAVNSHSCVNTAAQFAGLAALEGPQDAADAMIAAFAERRQAVLAALDAVDGIRCAAPAGAFYAFPDVSAFGLPAETVQNGLLEEASVATIAGTSFGARGEGHIRLSYANTIDAIEAAVGRLADWLDRSGRRASA